MQIERNIYKKMKNRKDEKEYWMGGETSQWERLWGTMGKQRQREGDANRCEGQMDVNNTKTYVWETAAE